MKRIRLLSRILACILGILLVSWSVLGLWYVHHPRVWIDEHHSDWPRLSESLQWIGYPIGDITDAMGLTGEDVVVTLNRPAPKDKILFAGLPRRLADPAPQDIEILDRGEFLIGWSPSLHHPVWCAYHVPARPQFPNQKRPAFRQDKNVPSSPLSSAYTRSGYDRGHMVPNYAAVTRFGPEIQARTFLTSNIAPQRPSLNRGVWREVEHRIAELWTARWGEIWVIVGCISNGRRKLPKTQVDVPDQFYQIVVAQEGNEIRALAVLIEQKVPWKTWPTRYLTTIDEIERLTGFDFLSDLDDAVEEKLEAALPSRLWPISLPDVFRLLPQSKVY